MLPCRSRARPAFLHKPCGLNLASSAREEAIPNMITHVKLLSALGLISAVLAFASRQEAVVKPAWTPPPSRTAKTPFAPKPFSGHNIFKGEAEVWLADAIAHWANEMVTPLDDKAVSEYVTQVGNNLVSYSTASQKHYEFIVTGASLPDAFTAGGGRIFISLGMLSKVESEDELAGVLAHEIGHDAFGHTSRTISRQMFWLTGTKKFNSAAEVSEALEKLLHEFKKQPLNELGETLLGFSRFDELEADRAAFYNTYRAGYNPCGLATVLKRMARDEKAEMGTGSYNTDQLLMLLLSTHPPTAQRSMALSWESNWVKMPPEKSRYVSFAFDEMKANVKALE